MTELLGEVSLKEPVSLDYALITSYTPHVYSSTAGHAPEEYVAEFGKAHMEEIAARGIGRVALCVTELDILMPGRHKMLAELAEVARSCELEVSANTWTLWEATGGEAFSIKKAIAAKRALSRGEKPKPACICNPEFKQTFQEWMSGVVEADIDELFLDEIALECSDHSVHGDNKDDNTRGLDFIDELTQMALREGFKQTTACVRARWPFPDMSGEIASMDGVHKIAVAPYAFHPQADYEKPVSVDDLLEGAGGWFRHAKAAADANGIEAEAWIQGFNIREAINSKEEEQITGLDFTRKYIQKIREAGITEMGLWTFRGGEDISRLNPSGSIPPAKAWRKISKMMRDRDRGLYLPDRCADS